MLGRIDDVDAAGEHGDRAVLERGLVRRRVDAAGEPRGDDVAGAAELAPRTWRASFWPGGRAVARADDGDHRAR